MQAIKDPLLRLTASVVLLICLGYILYIGSFILSPLAVSLLISILLLPLCQRLENRGLARTQAILLCVLLVAVVLGGFIWFLTAQMLGFEDQLPMLKDRFGHLFDKIQLWIYSNLKITNIQQILYVKNIEKNAGNRALEVFSSISGFTGDLVTILGLMPIYIFFILYYRTFFMQFLILLFKEESQATVHKIALEIKKVSQNYILGLLTVIVIVAVLNSIGLYILGIENPLFFGLLASLLAVIPYIGIVIGSILPAIVALVTKDSAWYSVGVILVMIFVQLLEGNIITPFIVGSRVSINQITAVLALLVAGSLWGAVGMVLALPFTAIIKVICDNVDGLKPWGYLLGEAPPLPKREKKAKAA